MNKKIQDCISSIELLSDPAVLCVRDAQLIHSNEKARQFFNRPLVTRQDLPAELITGLDAALNTGRRSNFCYRATSAEPSRGIKISPKYFDADRLEEPTCALLLVDNVGNGGIPPFISTLLLRELRDGCGPLHTFQQLAQSGTHQNDPDFREFGKKAPAYLLTRVERVTNVMSALTGSGYSQDRHSGVLSALIAEADQWNFKFHQGQFGNDIVPMKLSCQGPELMLSTCNLRRLKTLITEILVDVRIWSKSASIMWAEEHNTLGVPAARVDVTFDRLHHTVPYISTRNEGLGLAVAQELLRYANGRLDVTPGSPATVSIWLPLHLPDLF